MTTPVLLCCDMRMLLHNPDGWDPSHPGWTDAVKAIISLQHPGSNLETYLHPERPGRLTSIVDRLMLAPIKGVRWIRPKEASTAQLERVHEKNYVAKMECLAGDSCWLAKDTTAISPGSIKAASLAAGAGISAIEAISAGKARRAFCIVRPPGHHAHSSRAAGFCIFNNIAVTAAHARESLGYGRVMIWDWDIHHGNGTQEIFYSDPSVLVVDSHCAAPFYPGSGLLFETGAGDGVGFQINVPLSPGSGNAALLKVFDEVVKPAAKAFQPDILLVSSGFDCHHLDMVCSMDETGFAMLAQRVSDMADELCDGRLVVLLEGGYNAQALADSAYAVVNVLAGNRVNTCNAMSENQGCAAVAAAVQFHEERWANAVVQ